tara:strand:+ start:4858 stop:11826 length:6969 start_codon:yes stop_codon:yes gene_type:complete
MIRHIIICITFLYSTLSYAETTWVPINIGDITTFIPYVPSTNFTAPSNVQISTNGGISTLSWADVEHASKYEIQALNASGEWVIILITDELFVVIDSLFSGYSSVRVMACTHNSCTSTGGWSSSITLTVEPSAEKNIAIPVAPALASVPPTDTLHNAGIGLTPGSFKVDESGAATYSVPLKLPQGIASVTPSLSLHYSSGSGNGRLGIGFNLSGLSAISRCRQTQEQDGHVKSISLTNQDRFCLDGQKLLAVSGAYGGVGTEYRTEIDSKVRVISKGVAGDGPAYFTVERTDGSISYYGNQDISNTRTDSIHLSSNDTAFTWFIASTSDNLKRSENSLFFYYNTETDGFGENEVTIDSIEYSGNRVQFNYRSGVERVDQAYGYMFGEKVENTALLDDIVIYNHYSTISAIQSYHLTYENDSVTSNYRVKKIEECNGSSAGTCLPATIFDWHNQPSIGTFTSDQNLSLGSGTLKASVPFDLDGDGFNDLAYIVETSGHYDLYISYNNKGTLQTSSRIDSFSLNDGEEPSIMPLDIDGDSKMEIIYPRGLGGLNKWVSYDLDDAVISTIQDDRTGIDRTTTNYIKYLGPNTTQTGTNVAFNDVDADGDIDMIYRHNNANYIRLNSYGVFGSAITINIAVPRLNSISPLHSRSSISDFITHLPASDFNGDGVSDIVLRIKNHYESRTDGGSETYSYYWAVFELTEDNGVYSYQVIGAVPNSSTTSSIAKSKEIFVSDINGDGLSDVMHKSNGGYKLNISNGRGFADEQINIAILNADGFTVSAGDIQNMQFVDVNKDGQADILYFNKEDGEWLVHYQQAKTFGTSVVLFSESSFDSNTDNTLIGDWNGDGRLDTARIDYSSRTFYYRTNADWYYTGNYPNFNVQWTNQPGNRIHTITNGFGLKTYIEYDLLTNDEFYTKADNAETLTGYGNGSPVYDLVSPSYLVSTVTSDAPGYNTSTNLYETDNQVSVSYKYQGLRAQAGGRGNLGFEKLTSYDHQTNITTDTVYHQNFPYIGMPIGTLSYFGGPQIDALAIDGSTSLAVNQRINYSINTYNEKWLHSSSIVFPYIDFITEYQYSLNDAGTATSKIAETVTDNTYQVYSDNHANLNTIAVTTKNASNTTLSTVTTSNTYTDDDVSSWWLGRLSSTSVTHNRPLAYPTTQRTITRGSSFAYHSTSGMLTLETVNLGSSEELNTLHCYDTKGNEIKTIIYANVGNISCDSAHINTDDNVGNITNKKVFRRSISTYDEQGRYVVSKANDKFTLTTVNNRNSRGQVTQTTDINNIVTNIGYDDFGNQYYTGNSLGQWRKTTRHLYLDIYNTSSLYYTEYTTSSGKPIVASHFNTSGHAVSSEKVSFDGTTIRRNIFYDAYGRIVKESMPYFAGATAYWNITGYDVFGRVQSSETATSTTAGTTSTVNYNGLTVTTTVNTNDSYALSSIQVETKNILGESISMQDAAGSTIYQYNAVGNLTQVTGVDSTAIETTYDNYGRKIAMNDPNKGAWSYVYNNLGELISQTSANGFTTKFYRDSLGRTVLRAVTGNNVNDYTDYNFLTSHLLQSEGNENQIKQFFYDGFGRTDVVRTTIDNMTYSQQVTYDNKGRVFQRFEADNTNLQGCVNNGRIFGNCWGVQNHYNTYGYLEKQVEARNGASADAKAYYQVTAMDALGNVTHFNQSDNLTSSIKDFNQANGFINSISTESNGVAIQQNTYTFDGLGNLRSRINHTLNNGTLGQSESFDYDDINRLTDINNVEKIRYAANGNILWKHDVGNYCYSPARPHAVSGLGSANCTTQSYQYDANGNMTSGKGRTIGYSHFDKPISIVNSQGNSAFTYGSDRKRFKRVTTETVDGESVTTTTYYIGNVEVVSKSNSAVVTTRRNLPGAIELRRSNGSREINYLHKDHLGSIDTISDANGDIKQKLYFDAWGKKQVIDSGNYISTLGVFSTLTLAQLLDITPRGYTGHESVDHADIIHMNGRIYDPTLGRFLQADPHIQAPKNSQNYNRYSYVLNNPLSYTDPSGYFFKSLKKFVKKYWKIAVAAVAAYYTFGYALNALATTVTHAGLSVTYATAGAYMGAGAAAGFVGGAIATGSLRGALRGAFTGAILGGVTYANADTVTSLGQAAKQVGTSALGGCVAGAGSGGSCSESAKVAALAQALKVSADTLAGDTSSFKPSEGEAVVKPGGQLKVDMIARGENVDWLNSSVDNTGMGVTVDNPLYKDLIGKTVSEAKSILASRGISDTSSILSNSSGLMGQMGESGSMMSTLSQNVGGVRSASVMHDRLVGVLERAWGMENTWYGTAFTIGSIPPAFAVQYYALGSQGYYDYYKNLERNY